MANVPPDLRYTKDHEWAKPEGARYRVGITAYAQEQLGDVVFVELPKVATKVTAKKSFGVVESVKAVSDRSEEHTSELQSHSDLVCRLLLEKKKHAEQRPSRGST